MTDRNLPAIFHLPPIPRKIQRIRPRDIIEPLHVLATNRAGGWQLLRSNSETFQNLFEKYVFFLAAIPASSGYVGFCFFGSASLIRGIPLALAAYVLCVFFMYAATILAQKTAKMFDGSMTLDESGKLIVYSFLPFYLCGAFLCVPPLRALCLMGIVSLYFFFLGLPEMTRVPSHKRFTYCLLNIISWIIFVDFSTKLLFH